MTSLLDQYFAPIRTGTASSGAAGAATAGVDPQRLDYSIPPPFGDDPSDTTGEDAWDTVYLAEIPLPPIGSGAAKMTAPIKIKVDKTTKTGAAKPIVKVTGGEAIEGTITVEFVQEALPAMVAAAATLYPGAGPFAIRHPKATMARLDHVQITGWNDPPTPDAYGKFTWVLQYLQVSISAQGGKGASAVKTPKDVHNFDKPGDVEALERLAELGPGAIRNADGSYTSADGTKATRSTDGNGHYFTQKELALDGAKP